MTSTEVAILPPQLGDSVYLGSFLANIHCFGIVSDLDTPDMTSFSIEGTAGNGLLSTRVLMGPPGPAGQPSFILKLQQQVFNDPDDLPTNLTTETFDVGKYWIVRELDDEGNFISSQAWVWFGDHYEAFPMGTRGPQGPVPLITPTFELVDESVTENCFTSVTGDDYHPSWHTKVNKELIRGPVGPSTNISNAPDYDNSTPAQIGDAVVWNGTDFAPTPIGTIVSKFYTMPEAAFVNVPLAIGTSVALGVFVVPPQEWDCIPYITGHLRIIGVEADADPMIIGAEVRLGNATTGPVVARGYGNISTYTTLLPHASTPSTPNDAITPTNGRAVIPAGATGTEASLFIHAFNDGLAGIYSFEKRGAQISIMLIPV
jgi:hypothetical protein